MVMDSNILKDVYLLIGIVLNAKLVFLLKAILNITVKNMKIQLSMYLRIRTGKLCMKREKLKEKTL